jgi:hypothetical protein
VNVLAKRGSNGDAVRWLGWCAVGDINRLTANFVETSPDDQSNKSFPGLIGGEIKHHALKFLDRLFGTHAGGKRVCNDMFLTAALISERGSSIVLGDPSVFGGIQFT